MFTALDSTFENVPVGPEMPFEFRFLKNFIEISTPQFQESKIQFQTSFSVQRKGMVKH